METKEDLRSRGVASEAPTPAYEHMGGSFACVDMGV